MSKRRSASRVKPPEPPTLNRDTVACTVQDMETVTRADLEEVLGPRMGLGTLRQHIAALITLGRIEEDEQWLLWRGGTVAEQESRLPWIGYVQSWEPRHMFGKYLPVPWWKPFRCWAVSKVEAMTVLDRMARRQGYGLGGVQHITVDVDRLD